MLGTPSEEPKQTEACAVHTDPVYLQRVADCAAKYEPLRLNEPRTSEGVNKLLVLDVDYTLFDHRSLAERPMDLARPHLHEFLAAAYQDFDIVIWSATTMRWVELKMRELGCLDHSNFKLVALFDATAMITCEARGYGVLDVKPLGVIWMLYPQFSAANTIMLDDVCRSRPCRPRKCGR